MSEFKLRDPDRKWGEPRKPTVRLRVVEKLKLETPLVQFEPDELTFLVEELSSGFSKWLRSSRDMGYFDADEQANLLYLAGNLLSKVALELKAEMVADGLRHLHALQWLEPPFEEGEN